MESNQRVIKIEGGPTLFEYYTMLFSAFLLVLALDVYFHPHTTLTSVLWGLVAVSALLIYGVPLIAYLTGRWVRSIGISFNGVDVMLRNGTMIASRWEGISLRRRKPRVGRGTVYLQLQQTNSPPQDAPVGRQIMIPVTLQQGRAILRHPSCPRICLSASEKRRLKL